MQFLAAVVHAAAAAGAAGGAAAGGAAAAAAGAAPAAPAPPMTLPPDQVLGFVLLDIAIILIVARLVGALFVRIRQPRVVGEIIAGVLLGPSLLGPVLFQWDTPWKVLACGKSLAAPANPNGLKPAITTCFFPPQARSTLSIIGQIALVLFMFLVGLELDFSLLKGKFAGIASVGFGVVALPLLGGFLIRPALYNAKFVGKWGTPAQPSKAAFALMLGAMLSVTAFPVAVRILQEKKLSTTPMGAVATAAAALVTILMFLLVGVARGVATKADGGSQFLRFLGTAIYLIVAIVIVRPLLVKLLQATIRKTGKVSGEAFAIMLIVTFASAYTADRIGINVIVGGFIAGCIMPAREVLIKELGSRLSDLTVIVLLPIFLAFSGLQTDFTKLTKGSIAGLILFIVVGIVAKWGGGILFARLGGLNAKEANGIGVLMNCRGLLVLVVALVAFNSGVISPIMQVGGVLMALITTGMTGPLVDRFLPAPSATPTAQPARKR